MCDCILHAFAFALTESLLYVAEECFEDDFEDLEEDFFFEEFVFDFVDFLPEELFDVVAFELFAWLLPALVDVAEDRDLCPCALVRETCAGSATYNFLPVETCVDFR